MFFVDIFGDDNNQQCMKLHPYAIEQNYTFEDLGQFTKHYNFSCVDVNDGEDLNDTRKAYNTLWYLDHESLSNITDIAFNEKESDA